MRKRNRMRNRNRIGRDGLGLMTDISAPLSDDARKKRAALTSIFASMVITLAKFAAGLVSGSLALISEAGHAAVDTGATILTYLAIREASKPADDEHHYGHDKYEALAALIETGLLFGLALFVVIEATRRLMVDPTHVETGPLIFAVLAMSIIIDFFRWRALSKIARETSSTALAADALHFSSDLVASLLVTVGLIGVALGYPRADALASFGVAGFIAIAGWQLARRTVDMLLDTAPKGMAPKLRAVIEAVPGVVDVEALRLRPAGSRVIGEVAVGVPRTLPVERIAEIKHAVEDAVREGNPDAELTVTTNLRALDDETVLERVLLISARRRLPIHHVTVQEIDGRTCVGFDLELDGRLPYGNAHDIATRLENAMREELGINVEVESHLEPLETQELAGTLSTDNQFLRVVASLNKRAAETGGIHEVHNVRVRETAVGVTVNYHCRVDPALSVNAVHELVDQLDRSLRRDCVGIARVVGHAEPLKP